MELPQEILEDENPVFYTQQYPDGEFEADDLQWTIDGGMAYIFYEDEELELSFPLALIPKLQALVNPANLDVTPVHHENLTFTRHGMLYGGQYMIHVEGQDGGMLAITTHSFEALEEHRRLNQMARKRLNRRIR